MSSITSQSHAAANALPLTGTEDRSGLRASIERNGVLEPVIMFRGKILDGRTRKSIVDELNAEGKKRKITETNEQGEVSIVEIEFTCPTEEFPGNEQEAVEYVAARNLHRRHLTSSQKAIAGVRLFLLGKRASRGARSRGEEVTEQNAEANSLPADGDIAAWVAANCGSNRTYVFRALRIVESRGGKSLGDRVLAGELSINAALAELDSVEAEQASEQGDGGETEVPVVLDGRRLAVEPHLYPAFAARDDFKTLDQKLRAIITDVENICRGPGGDFCHDTEMVAYVKSLRGALKANQPHTTCPKCNGTGADSDHARQPCPVCHRAKYVNKLTYDVYVRENGGTPEPEAEASMPAEAVAAE